MNPPRPLPLGLLIRFIMYLSRIRPNQFAKISAILKLVEGFSQGFRYTYNAESLGNEMGEISFLIGSGFSHPAGYPIATCLNRKLRQIKASEITIHTSGSARFLNKGENDPFRIPFIPRDGQREFVEAFLKFYTSTIIGDAEKFEYEEFFDYYIDLFGKTRHLQEEEKFFTSFRQCRSSPGDGLHRSSDNPVAQPAGTWAAGGPGRSEYAASRSSAARRALRRVPISPAVLIAPMITEARPGHTAGASLLNGEVVRISTYFYSNLG